jgi:hypothetical protein
MENLTQFVQNETGVAATFDNVKANWGQCAQLVSVYCVKVLGWTPPLIAGASDWWTNPTVLANFKQIPTNQLQPGDIVVFAASSVINSPEFGHIDIFLSSIAGGYLGFDSNWGHLVDTNPSSPTYGYPIAHQVQHSFVDVLGGLRYNGSAMKPTAQEAHDAVMAFETEADGITPHQPSQADLDFGVSTPWNAYIPNFYPMVQRLRDLIKLLTNDRDTDLYPKINATCAALGLPVSATTDEITAAITALKTNGGAYKPYSGSELFVKP